MQKYIKDAIYWNGQVKAWLRISDLNLVEGSYYVPAVPAGRAVLHIHEAYPYEDWMEEYIGTNNTDIKDLIAKRGLLEFLDAVWHMGDKADLSRWQKADCCDWISWVEKQGKQEQKQWKPDQDQLDALHEAVTKACSTQYGVHLQDLEIDLHRLK